ncbi:magnetosome protein MamT [Magnetospirillum sp. UT-4]|uniref:magnetosome protein MamT n=1 Tax=Magnetospirillum sp. UT-4 TaxID=2681467 RepID=UPI0013858609|nr:magnetosome protein MamT [Magnetospirillum sp. UT-4]CAA7622252.1 conserved hypothetical protein [Magnetospirillum sp. UT-4]
MSRDAPSRRRGWPVWVAIMLVVGIGLGLYLDMVPSGVPDGVTSPRRAAGILTGRLPLPMEPSLLSPLERFLAPAPGYKLMTIRHIPPVAQGGGMPHPFVGDCVQCHLIVGGAPPGSQFKTPYGAVLESLSRVRKLGPPILPTSRQPHPPAGRCIKCHDIVVKVPNDRASGLRWQL